MKISLIITWVKTIYKHSREVAKLCGCYGGQNLAWMVKDGKKSSLYMILVKFTKTEAENGKPRHLLLGMQWAEKKFGEKPEWVMRIGAHHDEIEMEILNFTYCFRFVIALAELDQVHDTSVRLVHQRLKDLEDIAFGLAAVQKAYAIQAVEN